MKRCMGTLVSGDHDDKVVTEQKISRYASIGDNLITLLYRYRMLTINVDV